MEACQEDLLTLGGGQYPDIQYAPNDVLVHTPNRLKTGVAILAKIPITEVEKYYCGEDVNTCLNRPGEGTHTPIVLTAIVDGIRLGVVHFSWTHDGNADARQRQTLQKLLAFAHSKGEMILGGDFNIPRGRELYFQLAKEYHDNIPHEIATTIDPQLHRANREIPGNLRLVVDYLWSTPKYQVKDVRVESGVSDHCALVCTISLV
jgi:endonuclease/exonuclease/phosphatase family metal-dependent hydrolase